MMTRPMAAAGPQGVAVVAPGAVEARQGVTAALAREADLALEIAAAAAARQVAVEARASLVRRVAAGEALPSAAIAAAIASIAAAEETTSLLQDALRAAEGATKRAERALAEVLRAELRRRHPVLRAAADAALKLVLEQQEKHGRLDVLAADCARAAVGEKPAADLEHWLMQSAEVAGAGSTAT